MTPSSLRAPWVRIRQICLAAPALAPAVAALQQALGLQVAYRDPGVGKYGLENAVLPIGPHQFLEVVAPTRPGTAVGRFLARAPAPDALGAYMLICDCDDPAAARARAEQLGIRVINDYHYPDYHGVQLHPRDTGAVMIEFNGTPGGAALDGPYHPAGPSWQQAVTPASGAITAVRVAAARPAELAQQWAALFGKPAQPLAPRAGEHAGQGEGKGEGFVITLDLGRIEILPSDGNQPDALRELVLGHADAAPAPHASQGEPLTLCGVRISA